MRLFEQYMNPNKCHTQSTQMHRYIYSAVKLYNCFFAFRGFPFLHHFFPFPFLSIFFLKALKAM